MPTGWSSYYLVFLAAFLALGIPLALSALSFLLVGRRSVEKKTEPLPTAPPRFNLLGAKINPRFFLAANAALVLMTLGLALIPCASALHAEGGAVSRGLILLITIGSLAAIGLFYSSRKGDLGWITSYSPPPDDHKSGGSP